PQRRERVFVYAARDGSGLSPPVGRHAEGNGASGLLRFANAWDALADFDDPDFNPSLLPGGTWGDLLSSIPEGANYTHHTPRGDGEPLFGWRTKYWSFLLKLAKNRPSWTVQAQAGSATGPFHWRSRRLMTGELAALQCFPGSWQIQGAATSARRQIGNAVSPPVGEVLGYEIRRQLLGEKLRRRRPLTPSLRDDCPDPEATAEVPAKYLYLRDTHPDHPGPGLGPGALKRLEHEFDQAA
ncbi:MAG: DNA cytosine methyltransferase, partial [Ktedonobacterales bacterium]